MTKNMIPRAIRRNTWTPGDVAGDRSRQWSKRDLANELAMIDCVEDVDRPFWADMPEDRDDLVCEWHNSCYCDMCRAERDRAYEVRECWTMLDEFDLGRAWATQDLDADRAWDARDLAERQKAGWLAGE